MPFCPNCGTEVPENVNFCAKCGNAMQAEQISEDEANETENVFLKTTELTFFQKFLQVYWANPKSWLLDEFILEDDILTVKTRKGNIIQSPLSNISSKYSLDKFDRREFSLRDEDGNKLHFKEIPGMLSDEEWELIFSILSPEQNTFNKIVLMLSEIINIFKK